MVKISENWFVLDGVTQLFMGEKNPINPVIGVDNDGIILIDTGPPDSYEQMEVGLNDLGFTARDIKKIIITHYHFDHVGNLHKFFSENSKIEVFMGKYDIPYYEGLKSPQPHPIDMEEIKKLFPDVTNEHFGEMLSETLKVSKKVESKRLKQISKKVNHFTEAGGFDIIHTPGHTPGHLSVYIPWAKALIPGDLMMYWKGNFSGPVKTFCSDFESSIESLKKISKYLIDKLIGYHGSVFFGDVNSLINDYLKTLSM